MGKKIDYYVNFDDRITPERVRQALTATWGLDPAVLFAGTQDQFDRWLEEHRPDEREFPIARIFQEPGTRDEFSCRLEGDRALADAVGGISRLELTTVLCRRLGTRAVFEHGIKEIGGWMLVCADGWHGPVTLLETDYVDTGTILHGAYEPVPSDRHVYRLPAPEWYSGPMPESGYLHTDTESDPS